jgi:type IV pilus assembly protein PilV
MKALSTHRRRSHGFTLVEILVTLLIVSIGLLGIAALHSFSMRNNYDALLRSHASALASDITDRMRSNQAAVNVADSEYNVAFGERPAGPSRAIADILEWKDTLAEQLPEGDGQIAIDEATWIVTVSVQWGERDQAEPMLFTTETEI